MDMLLPFEKGFKQGIRDCAIKTRQFFTMMAIDLIVMFGLVIIIAKPAYPTQLQLVVYIFALVIAISLPYFAKKLAHDAP